MKLSSILPLSFVAVSSAFAADAPTETRDKVSYSIGADLGGTFKKQEFDINPDMLLRGFTHAYSGEKLSLTQEEMSQVMQAWQMEMRGKMEGKRKAAGDKNKAAGDTFLAENKKKEGVKTTASGLQYKILKEGKGEKPKATDTVSTNYRGTLVDGTEFDSSYKGGEPASFPVNAVIPGWTEALQLMPVGSKWQLYIPSNLAYGDGGQGPIPPNSTLIFDVELLNIEKPEKAESKDTAP
jgi:FKBP-type peptidyl-prolyl cis-trans isomerase FklB